MDFSGSTDPLAQKLEERIVLSQYLMAVQMAGDVPPQESGLTCSTWYGKHHTEMIWWHTAHFALWGHDELLEKNLHGISRGCRKPGRWPRAAVERRALGEDGRARRPRKPRRQSAHRLESAAPDLPVRVALSEQPFSGNACEISRSGFGNGRLPRLHGVFR